MLANSDWKMTHILDATKGKFKSFSGSLFSLTTKNIFQAIFL